MVVLSRALIPLVFLLAPGAAWSAETASLTRVTTEAMQALESKRDAKCYATAARLENFISGTPLSEEGRFEKIKLQKDLIRNILSAASAAPRPQGLNVIPPDLLRAALDAVATYSTDESGAVTLSREGEDVVRLRGDDVRHYGTIAYSYRTILGVGQDALLDGDLSGPSLDAQGVDILSKWLDIVTVAALQSADKSARGQNRSRIEPADLRAAWNTLLPASAAQASSYKISPTSGSPEKARLFGGIINEKLAAYAAYNAIPKDRVLELFNRNAQLYWARTTPMTAKETLDDSIYRASMRLMKTFAKELLLEAQHAALRNEHPVIRIEDAYEAAQKVLPFEMDDHEDITFFPNLDPPQKTLIEAYNMDSLRDFAVHWKAIQSAVTDKGPALQPEPDPFAAELIAEEVAQYGTLLFRWAGQRARADRVVADLRPEDLRIAASLIRRTAKAHRLAPKKTAPSQRVVSSAARTASEPNGKFFTEISPEAGVDYKHRSSDWLVRFRATADRIFPIFPGGGIASEDINGDGFPDLLFAGGGGTALYMNDGYGHFVDKTRESGIGFLRPDGTHGEARQPVIADFDNDGLQDILITYANDKHRLYRNLGRDRFEDVTDRAGLGGEGLIGGPATVFDFDGDGLLDVYIAYFGNYTSGVDPLGPLSIPVEPPKAGGLPLLSRDSTNASPATLFRNEGEFRFGAAGNGAENRRWAQAATHADLDLDGRQDIIVANDFGSNPIFRNLGDGHFENMSPALGITECYHSMNVGLSDLNRDGYPDIYFSNINSFVKDDKYVLPSEDTQMHFTKDGMATMRFVERSTLYLSQSSGGSLTRYIESDSIPRTTHSRAGWAWSAEFFDFDNDADDDLYILNGWNDYATLHSAKDSPRTGLIVNPNKLFLVNEEGRFRDASGESGVDFAGNCRSSAYLDLEGDGDLDVAVNCFESASKIFRNDTGGKGNHWIRLKLLGDPAKGSNRDAVGSRLVLRGKDGVATWRDIHTSRGFLSMNSKEAHFGLGKAVSAYQIDIWWPNGVTQTLKGLPADHSYEIDQRTGRVRVTGRLNSADK